MVTAVVIQVERPDLILIRDHLRHHRIILLLTISLLKESKK